MSDEPITIALTRYGQSDRITSDVLKSLAGQVGVRARILFLDQSESSEIESACRALSGAALTFDYVTIPPRSLAFARNRAIEMCDTGILLFIDDDAIADANWAARLSATLSIPEVAAATGKIVPLWHKPPLWASRSRLVREQYSLLDLGPSGTDAAKVIGANFGLNLSRAAEEAYFDETLGRASGNLLGGEETDLSDRLIRKGHRIAYDGTAVVHHQIVPDRIRYGWLARRFYYAGWGRARRGGRPSPTHRMRPWDIAAASLFAVPYLAGYVRGRLP